MKSPASHSCTVSSPSESTSSTIPPAAQDLSVYPSSRRITSSRRHSDSNISCQPQRSISLLNLKARPFFEQEARASKAGTRHQAFPSSLRLVLGNTERAGHFTRPIPVSYRLPPGPSEDETAVRMTEPLLSIQRVYAVDFEQEETMWIVDAEHAFTLLGYLRIAGRQLHFKPNDVYRPHTFERPPLTIFAARHLADPIVHLLDPRYPSVREEDLHRFRQALPVATGLRIFQYGEVEIICDGDPELLLHPDEWPLTIGGLEYFVTQASPARTVTSAASHLIPYGAKVSTGSMQSGGCLGVKIVGPDGLTSITAATHAFVKHSVVPTQTLAQKLVISFLAVPRLLRHTLGYFLPQKALQQSHVPSARPTSTDLPITSGSVWATKIQVAFLGVDVFSLCEDDCVSKRANIGKIAAIFDFPSASEPYPSGYVHDLCLIRGPKLPHIVSLPLLPRLHRFIPYGRAFEMRDKPLFTVIYPFVDGDNSAAHGLLLTGKAMDVTTRESILVAAEIVFRDQTSVQINTISESILWRTKTEYRTKRCENSTRDNIVLSNPVSQDTDGDYLSASDYSGSVLCAGSDDDSTISIPTTANVICFQNYETTMGKEFANPNSASLLCFKVGYKLPDYVYKSMIVMPDGIQASTSDKENLVLGTKQRTTVRHYSI